MKHILEAIEQERAKWAGTPIAVPTIWPNTRDAFFEALDRIAKAVKEIEAPGDGGVFERVAIKKRKENEKVFPLLAQALIKDIDEFTAAHAADLRAAEARHLTEVKVLKTDFNTLLSGWRDDFREGKTREVIASITVILLEVE